MESAVFSAKFKGILEDSHKSGAGEPTRMDLEAMKLKIAIFAIFNFIASRSIRVGSPAPLLWLSSKMPLNLAEKTADSIGLTDQFQGESFLRPRWHGSSNTHIVGACERLRGSTEAGFWCGVLICAVSRLHRWNQNLSRR